MGRLRRQAEDAHHHTGGSGFCWESVIAWCEEQDVGYVLGLVRNQRLVRALGAGMREALSVCCRTGRPTRIRITAWRV